MSALRKKLNFPNSMTYRDVGNAEELSGTIPVGDPTACDRQGRRKVGQRRSSCRDGGSADYEGINNLPVTLKFTQQHQQELMQLMALATRKKVASKMRSIPRAKAYTPPQATSRPTTQTTHYPETQQTTHSKVRQQDTADLLTEWARWCRVGDPSKLIGYPKVSSFARLLSAGSLPTPMINDDQAMAVNTAVCRLLKRHPHIGKSVMTFYFSHQRSYREVAKREGISKIEAQLRVSSGTNWIDAFLDRETL